MGIFDRLFGKKAQPTSVQAPSESPTVVNASFSDHFLRIMKINFYGPFSKSTSGEWVVAWRDLDPEQHRGGYRESGLGDYLLFNTRTNNIVLQGKMERPNHGHVANDGHFSLEDCHFGSELSGTFYVFSPTGEPKIKRAVNANIFNSALSDDGRFAVFQTANNPNSDDGDLLVALDVGHSKELFAIHPQTGWADKYEFSAPEKILYLCYKNNRRYGYSFDGTFLDSHRYDRERVEDASPTDLVLIVREKLNGATSEQLPTLLSMINRAFEGNLSDYRALAYRLKGEIQESLGNVEQAMSAYQEALNIDPKVGVKQKLKKLEKEIKQAGSGSAMRSTESISKPSELSPISCAAVQEVLYNFTQYAFIGGAIKAESLDVRHFPTVLTILRSGTLTQQDLASQPLQVQRVFYELLRQYIMFLTMNPELPFPPDFLAQSSVKTLGPQVTAYMVEHGWPFPQMLQQ